MKKIIFFSGLLFFFFSCSNGTEEVIADNVEQIEEEATYSVFGAEFIAENVIDFSKMSETFRNLKEGDTIPITFKSEILNVCQKKGCWMKMDLEGEDKAFVRFTDYGFFVPMNAANHEGIVSGRAYVSTISVDELKHYAKDAGKSQEEIDKITEPEITYSIQADGVLIKDMESQEEEISEDEVAEL